MEQILFRNGKTTDVEAIYTRPEFKQQCDVPKSLGCEITIDEYIKIDPLQRTTVPGIYACGDNVTKMRTVANSISMGTMSAITLNRDLIFESF